MGPVDLSRNSKMRFRCKLEPGISVIAAMRRTTAGSGGHSRLPT